MGRPSRFTPEQKIEIILRNLRGETQAALHRELGVATSQIKLWKQLFLRAGAARLRGTITPNPSALTQLKAAMARIAEEVKDWQPDVGIKFT
jgi:transposase-like protein